MQRKRICLDLDNVLASTDDEMRSVIKGYTDGKVALRYEEVVNFNYWECTDRHGGQITKADWHKIHNLFSQPDHILSIRPYEGIQAQLNMIAETFELHIVTSRLRPAWGATVKWLDTHGFPEHFLHFVQHGEKHNVLGDCAVSVEDHLGQAEAFAEIGTQSYLLAHPWNQFIENDFSVIRIQDWSALSKHILG